MANKNSSLDPTFYEYLISASPPEPEVLAQLRAETASLPQAGLQISQDQGEFMALLIRLMGAREVLEIGVFTGYSSIALALALPADGHITALDMSEEWTAIARRYWGRAGDAGKIELRLGAAVVSLEQLIAEGKSGLYDFAFIDADKHNYDTYYEHSLTLLRPGGLLVVDNVFWGGKVADPEAKDPDTCAIRTLNEKMRSDPRVSSCLLTVADGLALVLKH
jgi:predicted O-methyltransferase YrrM